MTRERGGDAGHGWDFPFMGWGKIARAQGHRLPCRIAWAVARYALARFDNQASRRYASRAISLLGRAKPMDPNPSFTNFIALVLVAVLAQGCANVGPGELSACLKDKQIMGAYDDFQSKNHGNFLTGGRSYLTGGLDRQSGRVTCYWQVHSLAADIIPGSDPIGQCYRDGNSDCTILMDGPKMIFEPTGKPQTVATATMMAPRVGGLVQGSAPSPGTEVVLKLLGAFAQGAAIGLAAYYTERAVSRPRSTIVGAAPPSRSRSGASQIYSSPGPLRCSRDIIPGPTGYGFTCSRW